MEKLSKSQILNRIGAGFLCQDIFEEKFIHPQTGRIVSVKIVIEPIETFIDKDGIKWVKSVDQES